MPLYWSLLDKVLYLSKDVYDMFLIYTVSISTFCSQVTIFSLVKNSETFVKGAQYITYAMFYVLFIYLFFWCCFFFLPEFFLYLLFSYLHLNSELYYIPYWIQDFPVLTFSFFKIGIHSMQARTTTMMHGVASLKYMGNLFEKNIQLKSVCSFYT